MTTRDEEEERRRQREERKRMTLRDRAHGSPPRVAIDGDLDGRSERRTGRVLMMQFRVTVVTKAVLRAIKRRDSITSDPLLLELLVKAYLEKNGHPPIVLPSEEELVARFERERERRDGDEPDDE